jgi:hypothetical protein
MNPIALIVKSHLRSQRLERSRAGRDEVEPSRSVASVKSAVAIVTMSPALIYSVREYIARIVCPMILIAIRRGIALRIRKDDRRFCHPVIGLGLRPSAAKASLATAHGSITGTEMKRGLLGLVARKAGVWVAPAQHANTSIPCRFDHLRRFDHGYEPRKMEVIPLVTA